MGWSWEASKEMTFELRVEGGEFRKSVPGRGNGIAISDEPMLSRNGNSSSVGEGGSQTGWVWGTRMGDQAGEEVGADWADTEIF